jgi:dihydroneopterin aldolase
MRKSSEPKDFIQLRGLRVTCIVGVLAEERERKQPLEIDIDLRADLEPAGASDQLDDTVNYGTVGELAAEICMREKAQLLERLANVIATEILSLGGVHEVTISIRKIRPPVPVDLHTCGVQITRSLK